MSELISNASNALAKVRPDCAASEVSSELEIRIVIDKSSKCKILALA